MSSSVLKWAMHIRRIIVYFLQQVCSTAAIFRNQQIATLVTHGYTDRAIKPNYFVDQQVVVVVDQHLATTTISNDDYRYHHRREFHQQCSLGDM